MTKSIRKSPRSSRPPPSWERNNVPNTKVLIAGASGYTGALAAKLIHEHPFFELGAMTSRSDAGRPLTGLYPHYRVPGVLTELDLDQHTEGVSAAIVAYPHGAAAPLVAELLDRGIKVVDLSADFRLKDVSVYEQWYAPHPRPDLIESAAYGLTELNRDAITEARLVACPGCYPTATILALAPLEGIMDLVVDAKSGVSGAGRAASDATHFVTADENVTPYKVAAHRHTPEIEAQLGLDGIVFTPHLLPLDQGELVSCYAKLEAEPGDVAALYREFYAGEPFIEIVDEAPGVRSVRDTNFCRINVRFDKHSSRVIAFGVIDNIWKGSSSQAVQNLNLMFGRAETEGLL
jgi:N-acetyl-gamma-glutamyl-phosphate reductase